MIGWIHAFIAVMLWGVWNVYLKASVTYLDVNPLVFSCVAFIAASISLLTYAGPGVLAKDTFHSVSSWAYGFAILIRQIIYMTMVTITVATEASLMQRFSVIVAIVLGWLFLERSPKKEDAFGSMFIIVGIVIVLNGFVGENRTELIVLLVFSGIAQAAQFLIAEKHKASNEAGEMNCIKAQCRVVGLVMFVCTLIFTSITLGAAQLKGNGITSPILQMFPDMSSFLHFPTYVSGAIFGATVMAATKYFEFSSVRRITAENFLAMASLAPLSTLMIEGVINAFSFQEYNLNTFSWSDVNAFILITLGSAIIAGRRFYIHFKMKN